MVTLVCLASLLAPAPPSSAQLKAAASVSAQASGISYLVLYQGRVIAEEYPNGGSATRPTELASGTKSFSGVMALCAQEDGLLSLDEKVSQTLPHWEGQSTTIRQLLSLVGGIPSTPGRVPSYADAASMTPTLEPGTAFRYGPAPFQIFGEIMRRKLKTEGVQDYLERRIFRPIGLEHGFWRQDRDRNPHLPSGAFITAREWAKFGEMVRNDGRGVLKPGQISELWKTSAVNPSYGLTWWQPAKRGQGPTPRQRWIWPDDLPQDVYMAAGAGGQRLFVIPSRDLVVVRQAPVRMRDDFREAPFLKALLGK